MGKNLRKILRGKFTRLFQIYCFVDAFYYCKLKVKLFSLKFILNIFNNLGDILQLRLNLGMVAKKLLLCLSNTISRKFSTCSYMMCKNLVQLKQGAMPKRQGAPKVLDA